MMCAYFEVVLFCIFRQTVLIYAIENRVAYNNDFFLLLISWIGLVLFGAVIRTVSSMQIVIRFSF